MPTLSPRSDNTDYLALSVKSSNILIGGILCVYVIALHSLYLVGQWGGFFIGLIILSPHAYKTILRHGTRTSPQAIVHIEVVSLHYWRLTTRAGKTVVAKLTGQFRSPWMIVFYFVLPQGEQIRVTILIDAVFKRDYIRLLQKLW